jgi:hypothetical protein
MRPMPCPIADSGWRIDAGIGTSTCPPVPLFSQLPGGDGCCWCCGADAAMLVSAGEDGVRCRAGIACAPGGSAWYAHAPPPRRSPLGGVSSIPMLTRTRTQTGGGACVVCECVRVRYTRAAAPAGPYRNGLAEEAGGGGLAAATSAAN